ncbi:MAG: protocatechuate 3,4-dioxygenase subunit beta [Betaproteobacteria bacterium]|nr:protocatechuate 3,4-dioxygenase subunit beta [Betaproteobacteria bacterium]
MTSALRKPAPGTHPNLLHPAYASTVARAPTQSLLALPQGPGELSGPRFDASVLYKSHDDLTRQCAGEPLGERIILSGRVLDDNGDPMPNTLLEVWQCNSAGRYHHHRDQHDAPLDPNFTGNGRVLTDAEGRYTITTIKPGAYPWRNHPNAWRPAHIHFSLFGTSMLQRLITQMYFPGDPLLGYDPIFNSVPSEKARERSIARFDWNLTKPEWALGYEFNFVLRGSEATPAN